jgi:hypothetical protein
MFVSDQRAQPVAAAKIVHRIVILTQRLLFRSIAVAVAAFFKVDPMKDNLLSQ